ncbi:MAG: tatA [Marmoricola sp.]|nr:tatA [Marmoricola sp.]
MSIGPTEITLVVLVIILLFGASKLPGLARGTGSALRIFKTETKGLLDDDTAPTKRPGSTHRGRSHGAGQRLTLPDNDPRSADLRADREQPTSTWRTHVNDH